MAKCSVASCTKDSVAKGYCVNHYYRWRKYGDATEAKQVQFHGLTLADRFSKYVKKTVSCWLWIGGRDASGYGKLNCNGKPVLAHRISWEIHHGPIPEKLYVLHKCDNPSCVNPDHLYVGDQFNNMDDMWSRGRANPGVVSGEKHGMAKLTEDQVRAIRKATGSDAKIATEFGVKRATVNSIRTRKTWQHVKEV